jgi:hypothetical protein
VVALPGPLVVQTEPLEARKLPVQEWQAVEVILREVKRRECVHVHYPSRHVTIPKIAVTEV